ncbi:GPP34 family phosphoprotein [Micromonospora sp. BRA006-A]|nr:GPP34 family phosphoprotein [Micromonospora sp. BRA006-A]
MDGLLLTDELVLLAYDDDGVNRLGSPHLGYGLAGAVLLELALAGRVEVADERLVVTDPAPTGVPLLDEALATVGSGRPRKPKDWIGKLAKGLPERVLGGLVDAGCCAGSPIGCCWSSRVPAIPRRPARSRRWRPRPGNG